MENLFIFSGTKLGLLQAGGGLSRRRAPVSGRRVDNGVATPDRRHLYWCGMDVAARGTVVVMADGPSWCSAAVSGDHVGCSSHFAVGLPPGRKALHGLRSVLTAIPLGSFPLLFASL